MYTFLSGTKMYYLLSSIQFSFDDGWIRSRMWNRALKRTHSNENNGNFQWYAVHCDIVCCCVHANHWTSKLSIPQSFQVWYSITSSIATLETSIVTYFSYFNFLPNQKIQFFLTKSAENPSSYTNYVSELRLTSLMKTQIK